MALFSSPRLLVLCLSKPKIQMKTSFLFRSSYFGRNLVTDGSEPRPPPSSREHKFVEFLQTFFRRKLVFNLFSGLALAVCGGYLYFRETEEGITKEMVQVFEKGGVSGWENAFKTEDSEASIERKIEMGLLSNLLDPKPKRIKQYGIVIGPHGVGKSTLVRQCIRQIEKPRGVVYFLAPAVLLPGFITKFRQTVGYRDPFDPMVRLRRWLHGEKETLDKVPLAEPEASWYPLEEKLLTVAQEFKILHKKPAVLVIDGADLIAKKNESFFATLQDFAKLGADMGVLRVVFISSDGVALNILQSRSAISRAAPVLEICEIDDSSAIEYLHKAGVDMPRAELAVSDVTGGSFALMLDYIAKQKSGESHEQIWSQYMNELEGNLKQIGVEANHVAFRRLIDAGILLKKDAIELFEENKCEWLVKNNILAVHPKGGYRFNSRYVRTYFALQQ